MKVARRGSARRARQAARAAARLRTCARKYGRAFVRFMDNCPTVESGKLGPMLSGVFDLERDLLDAAIAFARTEVRP